MVKNPPANAEDLSWFDPWVAPGGEHGNPSQYSCLENPLDRGVWQVTVRGVAKGWTQLK